MSESIPKSIEKGPEKILTKSEVMEGIDMFAKNVRLERELSDEHGLYLLGVVIDGEKPGETIEYEYLRKGKSPGHKGALETTIHRAYYSNGMPVSGGRVAVFLEGKWVETESN